MAKGTGTRFGNPLHPQQLPMPFFVTANPTYEDPGSPSVTGVTIAEKP
jgi:hypothetical protein